MNRKRHILITIGVMLIVSRFLIRIIDATVQIDSDWGLLIIFLVVVNGLIGRVSYLLYKKKRGKN